MESKEISILVVDDEILIRDLLYDFFSSHGYKVHLAENGRVALEIIDKVDFNVALLDLKMPEINGLEVAKVISSKKPAVPIVIMTAFPSLDSAIDAIKYDVYEYIVKPFKIAQLFKVVESAIREYNARTSSNYSRTKSAN